MAASSQDQRVAERPRVRKEPACWGYRFDALVFRAYQHVFLEAIALPMVVPLADAIEVLSGGREHPENDLRLR